MRWLGLWLSGCFSLWAAPVADVLPIEKVWAGHPVAFALLTAPHYQYAAYFDADRRMTVAQRRLDQAGWVFANYPPRWHGIRTTR